MENKVNENGQEQEKSLTVLLTQDEVIEFEAKQPEGFLRGNFANLQNIHLTGSLRFADTKAGALMAVSGIILPQTLYILNSDFIYQKITYLIGLVLLIIAMFLSFLVVLPISKQSKQKGIIYWNHISNYTEQEFLEHVKTMPTSEYLDAWLKNNYIQATILTRKFKRLSLSFHFALIACGIILLSAILPTLIDFFKGVLT